MNSSSTCTAQQVAFEVEPMQVRDDEVLRCSPDDADLWSVYQRPAGVCCDPVASWLADFATEQDARAFAVFKAKETQRQEVRS